MKEKLRVLKELFGELWVFFRERKKWWLAPLIVLILLLGILLAAAEGSALAPLIYTIF